MTSTEMPSDRIASAGGVGTRGVSISWTRVAKLGGAASILAVGAYAVARDQFAIASDYAVVSAYSVALRAPIDGVVSGKPLHVGDAIDAGAVLTEVANDLVDDQRLTDLSGHLARARAELDGLAAQRLSLGAIRADLERRYEAFAGAGMAELRGTFDETANTLAAAADQRELARSNLDRSARLAQSGFASQAELDKAKADSSLADHQTLAQQGRLDALQARLAALEKGIILESGANDVAYSRQRADELDLRLIDLDARYASARADVDETSARLAAERRRVAKISDVKIVAPLTGTVWKVEASQGERVGAGQSVAQIVDCRAAFVIAQVPQSRMPEVEIGGTAQFRLSGEDVVRTGRVSSLTGDATGGDKNLAAAPFVAGGAQSATVRVAIDADGGACLVGRTAHVLLPSTGQRFLSRLLGLFG